MGGVGAPSMAGIVIFAALLLLWIAGLWFLQKDGEDE